MKRKPSLVCCLLFNFLLVAAHLHAQTPQLLNYQGKLIIDGKAVQGSTAITFTIYDADTGGNVLWTEQRTVTVINGTFNVLLGNITPFPKNLFSDGGNRFLALKVGNNPELNTRFRITSVAYAIKATQADTARVAQSALSNGHSLDAADGTPTDAVFVDNDGNVGIGTTTPKAWLDIDAPITKSHIRIKGAGSSNHWDIFHNATAPNDFGLTFRSSDGKAYLILNVVAKDNGVVVKDGEYSFFPNGNVGIGEFAESLRIRPEAKLHVKGNIKADGNVGIGIKEIGIKEPDGVLHVVGTTGSSRRIAKFQSPDGGVTWISIIAGPENAKKYFDLGVNDTDAFIQTVDAGNIIFRFNQIEKMRIVNSGNVGIGTSNPAGMLDVAMPLNGVVRLGKLATASEVQFTNGLIRSDVSKFQIIGRDLAGVSIPITFGQSANDFDVTIETNGNVGIGATNPTEKLFVAGNIRATGSITPGSSRELKENIADLSLQEAVSAFKDLNPVKFNYKADAQKDLHIGFIAEDVPELLATSDRKAVNPMDVIAVLTKVVQAQQKELAVLREEVKALKQKIQ